ncbi:hypothetical protein OZX65_06590 [Leuconostocaceae bacterium ESL0723]|nr:hypothetical protein OZX65_06590 [Leuconostocaceae bacterium ESL0723]
MNKNMKQTLISSAISGVIAAFIWQLFSHFGLPAWLAFIVIIAVAVAISLVLLKFWNGHSNHKD